ncbi:MAG TPA: AAA family ATPase [Candidatus Dormibacteraeota bacterium]
MAVLAPAAPAPSTAAPIAFPPVPTSVEETGLPFSFICDLVLKVMYFNGGMLGRQIAQHICLPFALVETTLKFLADEGYCGSTGVRMNGLGSDGESIVAGMQFLINTAGRERARELIELNQYAGPAPVTIEVYNTVARHQARIDAVLDRATLREAFSSLVLPDTFIDRLGPALNARQAVFLYGPPGNGKTSIAEACARILGPPLFVPKALYVHGEVIRFFDPIHHLPVERNVPAHDRRWTLTERPVVKVGGELLPRMLDLGFDPVLGFYEASLQLKANGGLFLVDDFGRQQHMGARDLLNRLIVPLEKGVDYLNIARAGTSVAVPFTNMLILSTNLRPHDLIDEAFLRRVRFKVLVPNPTADDYKAIWRRVCAKEGVAYNDKVVAGLMDSHYKRHNRALHGAHPRDLLNHILAAARYMGRPAELSDELLELATSTYFVESDGQDW